MGDEEFINIYLKNGGTKELYKSINFEYPFIFRRRIFPYNIPKYQKISRKHFEIYYEEFIEKNGNKKKNFLIVDTSINGTLLNGKLLIKNHRTKLIDGDKIGILWKINKNKNELSSSLHIYLGWTFNILIDESKINYLQKNNSFIQLYFTNRFPKIYLNKKNYNSLKKLKDYNEKKRKSGDNEMKSNEENLNSKKNKSSNFLKKETSIEKEKLKNFQEEINLVNNFSNSIKNDLKISFSKNQPEDDRRRKLWTPEEDDKLKNLVIKYKPSTHEDWGLIANELGRTIKSVKHKYNDYKLYKLNI